MLTSGLSWHEQGSQSGDYAFLAWVFPCSLSV